MLQYWITVYVTQKPPAAKHDSRYQKCEGASYRIVGVGLAASDSANEGGRLLAVTNDGRGRGGLALPAARHDRTMLNGLLGRLATGDSRNRIRELMHPLADICVEERMVNANSCGRSSPLEKDDI
jgi:hypothetical protein